MKRISTLLTRLLLARPLLAWPLFARPLFASPLLILAGLFPATAARAQTPQSFSYQAVARDAAGAPITPTATIWYTNTSFQLMPFNGGTGNLGLATTPLATYKLTIQPGTNGNASISGEASIGGTLTVGGSPGFDQLSGAQAKLVPSGFIGQYPLSINAAAGDVWGAGFYATSDARVKHIIGPSDAAADLDKLNRIQVTDYIMRDTLTNGHRKYKKVIAQQVEEVYPQIIRKQKGFIPNVYQETAKMDRMDSGYLLTFSTPHHLSMQAARLRVEAAGTIKSHIILAIPSDHEVVIKSPVLKATHAFVYGEEVDDFRSVDYEGLTTLNISATQELSKLIKQQAEAIALLKKQVRTLEAKVKGAKPSTFEPTPFGK